MMDGITFMVHELVPPGTYVLLRRHTVAHCGAMAGLGQHWKPGDIVCVNQATFDGLLSPSAKAEEARR
jgi:hypothetical protein